MYTQSIFTADEKKLLSNISSTLELDINNMLQDWINFVNQVEKGYTLTIDDYTNDVNIRDILLEELNKIPSGINSKIIKILNPLDERFKEITNTVKDPLLPGLKGEEPAWWWYRIPKKLIGELRKDVNSLGIS